MYKIKKAFDFIRRFGFKLFLQRIYAEIQHLKPDPNKPISIESNHNVLQVIQRRFDILSPLRVYWVHASPKRRINLVTDSINSGSLFGGVATSFILSSFLSRMWDCELRIITRTQEPNKKNFYDVLSACRVPFPSKVNFAFAYYQNPHAEIAIGDGDIFLTTSWWTTWSVKEFIHPKRIIYLLQEDERTFYPYGDDHLRCTELLKDPRLTFVINTQLLYQHFQFEGFENIKENGTWFEPAWPDQTFYYDYHNENTRNFFFYARPNNFRNLFYRGLEVIESAVEKQILNINTWQFHFVGKDIPVIKIMGKEVKAYQNLRWSDYASLVRKMDLGLSLMYSAHPSYPPIDLAASGAVVVTNRFGVKQDLSQYSKNIICKELRKDDLLDGLVEGVALMTDKATRVDNYENSQIPRKWEITLEETLKFIDQRLSNV